MLSTAFTFRVDSNQAESLAAYLEYKWSLPEKQEIVTFYMTEKLHPLFVESLS